MRPVHEAHGVGEGVVPGALVVDGVALRIAGGQRLDQRAFRRGDAADQREGGAGGVIGAGERRGLAGGIHQFPGKVVVRPGRVADAPMGHGAVRVGLQRLLEAGDASSWWKPKHQLRPRSNQRWASAEVVVTFRE